ncbi:hypothetical protein Agub_g10319 [Astrephomene gubernaculifera]|uniref:Uncharacterized protein n=1 Tax=Astrephomene gubernaculifera TaxID=47775 RepID=A0AAD3HNY5_9CHLO|nr:hypothetical protein Agub_g10319 [Astrephomene gubernaculifera]
MCIPVSHCSREPASSVPTRAGVPKQLLGTAALQPRARGFNAASNKRTAAPINAALAVIVVVAFILAGIPGGSAAEARVVLEVVGIYQDFHVEGGGVGCKTLVGLRGGYDSCTVTGLWLEEGRVGHKGEVRV